MVNQATVEYLRQFRTSLRSSGFVTLKKEGNETWRGNIEIEWLDKETKQRKHSDHNVEISFGHSFPYQAPEVHSLDTDLTLSGSLHINPQTGTLCLWPSAQGWQPYFDASRLLNRIREWFHCYHTGEWPSNSELPDLHLYLDSIGMVLIGEEWRPDLEQDFGTFSLWRPADVKNLQCFPCLAIAGEQAVSVHGNPETRLYRRLLMKPKVRQAGAWCYVREPIAPPHTLAELLVLIDFNLEWAEGEALSRLVATFAKKSGRDGFPLALGYTDNQQAARWVFLWAQFPQQRKRNFRWSSKHSLSHIKLKSFRTAPADNESLLRRTAYISNSLREKTVTIFGCGSLGSSIALLLVRAGVDKLNLVDHDVLTPGNVVRHACGFEYVGLPKTLAIEQLLGNFAPDCSIEIHETTWDRREIAEYIAAADAVVDATANYNFSLILNEVCVGQHRSVVFTNTYRQAQVGRMIICTDNRDPCLACYSDPAYWNEDDYPLIPQSQVSEFIEDGCGSVTVEATAIDVEAVANMTARIIIKLLRGDVLDGNLVLQVNEPLDDGSGVFKQPGIRWYRNSPLSGCAVCSNGPK